MALNWEVGKSILRSISHVSGETDGMGMAGK